MVVFQLERPAQRVRQKGVRQPAVRRLALVHAGDNQKRCAVPWQFKPPVKIDGSAVAVRIEREFTQAVKKERKQVGPGKR